MVKAASIVALFLVCISRSAFAVPILQGPTDGATGITGLEISGAIYNVFFSEDETSYEDFYGGNTPTFLGDATDLSAPTAAAASIRAFLSANSVTGLAGFETVTPGFEIYVLHIPAFIDILVGPDLVSFINVGYRDGVWDSGGQGRTGSEAEFPGFGWVRLKR